MTTYNEIAGRRVNFLSSDPTYVDTNSDGQVWYNSTTATLKAWLPTGAWRSGGNLNTARGYGGGAGTQTAALSFGGYTTANSAITETYNSIAWTSVANLNLARPQMTGFGATNTAAIAAGGGGGGPVTGNTESWNGSSWTTVNPMNTARNDLAGIGIQTAGLVVGGVISGGAGSGATETWNGTSWTSNPTGLNTPRYALGGSGFGTQTAGILAGGNLPYPGPVTAATESWNGSSWTSVNSLNTARNYTNTSGTQTAGLCFGGSTPTTSSATELWNGSSWTTSPASLATARFYGSPASSGTQSSALMAGGDNGTARVAATEEWNIGVYSYSAAAWASGGNLPTATNLLFGFGTQTATLAAAGNTASGDASATYLYNGTSWTTSPATVGTARHGGGSANASPQTSGLIFAGYPSGPISSLTESWNGSTWTAGGNLNTGRKAQPGGTGIQTAALCFGGQSTPGATSSATESYNGSTWTTVNSLNTGRYQAMGFGIQAASIIAGGFPSPGAETTASESWNGTSWTTVNSINTARGAGAGAGIQTAGIIFNGQSAPGAYPNSVESYNGSIWTNLPAMSTARRTLAGAGTQAAAIGFGGDTPTITTATEEWTGEVATANSKTLTTS
jgi:hypothetical protein